MGYAGKSRNIFFEALLPVAVAALEPARRWVWLVEGPIDHATSLVSFLIFCKRILTSLLCGRPAQAAIPALVGVGWMPLSRA
jgi:hypothetical protein